MDQYGAATDQPNPDLQQDPEQLASYWLGNIEYAHRKLKKWHSRGDQIIRRYRNNRAYNVTGIPLSQRRMNVLWANVQTQIPVLIAQLPKANVQRRNKDKDPIGRQAAIVLERVLNNSIGMQDFEHTIKQNVQDLLLPGLGNSITEYVAETANDEVGWQEAKTRYIHWKDQITNVARNWDEVWFWGYKACLSRREVRELVLRTSGDEERALQISQNIVLDHKEDKNSEDSAAKATVWCIWDKSTKTVLHIATGYVKEPLAVMPPPVNFDGFFPVPRPLSATVASDSTIPVPDFDQYADQADEIDMLTQRINMLARSLRMRGVYPADMDSVKQLMENSGDQDMIPIDNWAMFAERGGAQGIVAWFPLKDVAETLDKCYAARNAALEVMYEVTGISDIMRGATAPSETATAQQLKSQYGSIRIRDRQREVQRYIRDIIRLQSEICAELFELPVLQAMSGVKLLSDQQKQTIQQAQAYMQQYQQQAQLAQQQGLPVPPPPNLPQPTPEMMEAMKQPTWEEVLGLLRNEKLRGFVIDVETDSTIEADQMQEQAKASEFLGAVTQFVGAWAQILPAAPMLTPMVGEMLAWGARQFKAGQSLETAIDEGVESMTQAAKNPPPPKPDPKLEAETKKAEAAVTVAQIGVEKAKLDFTAEAARHQQTMERLAFEAANPPPQPQQTNGAVQ